MVAANGYDERFAALLKERGLSPKDVAAEIGVSYQAVKKIVDGKSKMMAADNNAKAAAYLKVNPDWLATGEGSRERGHAPYSPEALAVASLYDQASSKDRRYIWAVAHAALSEDGTAPTAEEEAPPAAPRPVPAPPR